MRLPMNEKLNACPKCGSWRVVHFEWGHWLCARCGGSSSVVHVLAEQLEFSISPAAGASSGATKQVRKER